MATHAKISAAKRLEQVKKLKFHEVLAIAIKALEKAQKPNSPVKVDMLSYHKYVPGEDICTACLGGLAVIEAFQLDMTKKKWRHISSTGVFRATIAKLATAQPSCDNRHTLAFYVISRLEYALDEFRTGRPINAVKIWLNSYADLPQPIVDQLNIVLQNVQPISYFLNQEKAVAYYKAVYKTLAKADI